MNGAKINLFVHTGQTRSGQARQDDEMKSRLQCAPDTGI